MKYKVFKLYGATGSHEHAPEGFLKSPSLEVYLNHLWELGYRVLGVTGISTLACWYNIVTEKR
jgi:hypothetical protein